MSDTKKFTTRTASLKATKADIIKLDVKLLNINGEPLKSAITIKDERENITENDIWPNPINNTVDYLTSDTDGNIVYQGLTNNTFDYSEMTDEQKAITQTAVKVIDNKVLGNDDELLMNWDTKSFTNSNGSGMFLGCSNLTTFDSDLSSLTYGDWMFAECSNLTTFNSDLSSLTHGEYMFYNTALKSFDSDLSSLTNGYEMFYKSALSSFSGDLSSLTYGNVMFEECYSLTTFNSDLSNLTDGGGMFEECYSLTTFNSDLSNLTDGSNMFLSCSNLTTFDSDLSSLTNGDWMFAYCSNLTTFDSDLSSLTNGYMMFSYCSALASFNSDLPNISDVGLMFNYCSKLTSFNGDLSNLTNGNYMFYRSALTSFNADLSSLTDGYSMFYECKLDDDSLNNIIHTINDLSDDTDDGSLYWGVIDIGLGCPDDDTIKENIAKHCCCDTWEELNLEFLDKGWTVNWQYDDTQSSSNTLNLLDGQSSHLPIWAKLVEVTDEKGYYEYVLEEDTTKHFNIHWYHETNGSTDGYQQFGSLLEAMGYFGLIPKDYSEQ